MTLLRLTRPGAVPRRVLLVEDNRGDARLVAEMLRTEGPEPVDLHTVGTLAAALGHIAEHTVECVLLDLSLPDASGLDGMLELRAAAPELPVVVLSGSSDEDIALQAVQEGAQDYLIKGQVDGALVGRAVRYAVERKKAQLELAHQALHDALTGLPNRALFMNRLEHALARHDRHAAPLAVMFLDLDGFKEVNDTLGHEAGDQLLLQVAARLQDALRATDTVARFGGDEFTVLCEELSEERQVIVIAERMGRAVSAPYELGESVARVSVSVGIALASQAGSTASELLRDADTALYRAKESGKDRWELYDTGLRERAERRAARERALFTALQRDELRVHYQPQVDLAGGSVVGYEALMRWEHPEDGITAAADFIALAEETRAIVPLGTWVLREACADAAGWHADGDGFTPAVAVNVSAQQLAQPDLVAIVWEALEASGLAAERLVLEVGEHALANGDERLHRTLDDLRRLGVLLAVDDFGRREAPLLALTSYPVQAVKLDRTLVAQVEDDGGPVVGAIVGLASSLGLVALAEGVETPGQVAALRALGCGLAQGHALGVPAAIPAAPAVPFSA